MTHESWKNGLIRACQRFKIFKQKEKANFQKD